ncbi:PhzF family phenazine biosynthesis protein [Treponema brennaborense]|uniref:Phenazine biosynthesis protein PhzF family n=1 Tax=Treponema brennaborense (strain DSM 12168 / CIP 105900 / DD5/3) TaxID=906968 RepID=F4LKQ6_TREBD|nr:PhzF family phenazine biosynthesis protein [Treponema brennaborense]AEE15517.1 phenazine biosynthesis protein PhzF family [Treponema brennaborense DSM 12168]
MNYYHVDVFSSQPLSGNGLTVVFLPQETDPQTLLHIAQEFKQFETVFIYPERDGVFPIRIFTVQEELPFAGHPVLGTAALLHELTAPDSPERKITLQIKSTGRSLSLQSLKRGAYMTVEMNQGKASVVNPEPIQNVRELCEFLRLTPQDIDDSYPMRVVSTGLAYLLIPIKQNLAYARIRKDGFEAYLAERKAKFAYFFQTDTLECRTWDNSGSYEDVATGSAAGSLVAYLVNVGAYPAETDITLSQGRFCGRPSTITGRVTRNGDVVIRGDVSFFASGTLLN